MSSEQISITIMGRAFNIGTLLQAVDMLNQKINAIKQGGRIIETDKIAIMAALNVVHDLLKMSMKDDLAIGEFERKITDMAAVCDKALAKLPPGQ